MLAMAEPIVVGPGALVRTSAPPPCSVIPPRGAGAPPTVIFGGTAPEVENVRVDPGVEVIVYAPPGVGTWTVACMVVGAPGAGRDRTVTIPVNATDACGWG